MMRLVRPGFTILGIAACFLCAVLMVESPRGAMELLVLTSPVYVALWLIVTLTGGSSPRRPPRPATVGPVNDASVIARDGGRCAVCGTDGSTNVRVRRPARPHDRDPLARFVTMCNGCAAASRLTGKPPGSAQRTEA